MRGKSSSWTVPAHSEATDLRRPKACGMRGKSRFSVDSALRMGVLAAFAVALSSCTMFNPAPKKTVTERVTSAFVQARDPQNVIGKAEHPRVVADNGGAYENAELEKLLAVVVAELVANDTDKARPRAYRVTILDSPKVNAFALPGGYLYVTRGLIALANDAAEVATVLAHEMAHVAADHGVERIAQAKATDLATKVATGVVSNGAKGALVARSSDAKLARFSQKQELEADALGIRLAGKSGFDAFGATRFLTSLRRWSEYQAERGGGSGMMSTHPSTPRRLALAKAHARNFGPPGTGKALRERYLKGIDGLTFGDAEAQGFVRGRRFAHKGLSIAFEVPRGFALKNRSQAAVATGRDGTAIRYDVAARAGETANLSAADYIASGWVNGLDSASVKSTKLNGFEAATARATAGAWRFSVAVFADGKRFHRFIVAAPGAKGAPEGIARSVTRSFRRLSETEREALAPLRVSLHTVKAGETVASLARTMPVTAPRTLFRTLNALGPNETLAPGRVVKLVRE